MILQTGGSALGDISTKSKPAPFALSCASDIETIPTCSPCWSISLTSGTLI
jgi:hypothetical protein